jgi:hypothetical protein
MNSQIHGLGHTTSIEMLLPCVVQHLPLEAFSVEQGGYFINYHSSLPTATPPLMWPVGCTRCVSKYGEQFDMKLYASFVTY